MITRRKRDVGSAHSSEFVAALYAFFLMALIPMINLIGLVTGVGTLQLLARESAVRAGNAASFDEALNEMDYTARQITASGFGAFAKLRPVGGYNDSGVDLYVADTNINTQTTIIHGPNTPAVSALNQSNYIYTYKVVARFDVGPFLNLSSVPVIGQVPGLGAPVRMTMHADRSIEHLAGLNVGGGGFVIGGAGGGFDGDGGSNSSSQNASGGSSTPSIASSNLFNASAPSKPWQTASTNGVTRNIPNEFSTWHYQLSGPLDLSNGRDVYDTDLYETTTAEINLIHQNGGYAIAYMNTGAWQPGMPDSPLYPPSVIGKKPMQGWPQERWLDIRQIETLRPIIRQKLQLAKDKGFDGVEPDNMDGYSNTKEFNLTAADQIAFDQMVAEEAHAIGLAVFLKNTDSLVPQLEPSFDGAVVEQAFRYKEATSYQAFRDSHKPVFEVEYAPHVSKKNVAQAEQLGFNVITARRNLEGPTKVVTQYP